MNDQIHLFLDAIDAHLAKIAGAAEVLDLYLFGRAALVAQYKFQFSTRDIDIVWSTDSLLQAKAIELFGKSSPLSQQYQLYLDPIAEVLPPLPQGYKNRALPFAGKWRVIRVWTLEVHDIAVSKLKRFHAADREDIQQLCDRQLLKEDKLMATLKRAFPWRSPKDEDAEDDPDTPEWAHCLKNCRRVIAYLNGTSRSV